MTCPHEYTSTADLHELAARVVAVHRQAVCVYAPVVQQIIRTGSREVRLIGRTLDELLGFCGDGEALNLFKAPCRHYLPIDPTATVGYVHAYRDLWDAGDDA